MSIKPAIPVLRGRKDTDLRVTDEELVLRQAHQEHHIPFSAIARVHAEQRAVEVRLTAPAGTAPTVYRVEDVSAAAATVFAQSVNAVLAPNASESPASVDGSTLVTTRTATREPETEREALRRRVKWLVAGSVLAIVAMSVLVSVVAHPINIIFVVLCGVPGFTFSISAAFMVPQAVRPWQLPRHGITVTADNAHDAAQPSLYLYSDLDGNTLKYFDTSGRPSIEVSYDPREPAKAVRADGTGRWGPALFPLAAGAAGLLLLVLFFATPFMDFGPVGEEYRNQYR
ncbi:hypothetical protein [Streptomyces goshikiensis]|uniref:hypothetical protein n=1 Tax=Streptomyces goshikiensis TaxID=1942 RepID=UPI0036687E6F